MSTRKTFAALLVIYVVGYLDAVHRGGDPGLNAWFLAALIVAAVGLRLAIAWLVGR